MVLQCTVNACNTNEHKKKYYRNGIDWDKIINVHNNLKFCDGNVQQRQMVVIQRWLMVEI